MKNEFTLYELAYGCPKEDCWFKLIDLLLFKQKVDWIGNPYFPKFSFFCFSFLYFSVFSTLKPIIPIRLCEYFLSFSL